MDRNFPGTNTILFITASLSARRAWIEILKHLRSAYYMFTSLSARRAWIEIIVGVLATLVTAVALRKESVDRNDNIQLAVY